MDLRTGEELWFQNGTSISCGEIFRFESPNQHGAIAYLWNIGVSSYDVIDAYSGVKILSFVNVTSPGFMGGSRIIFDDNGNLLVYQLDGTNNWVAMWNSTKAIQAGQSGGMFGGNEFYRPPTGAILDWKKGIQWNHTVTDVPGVPGIATMGKKVIIAAAAVATDVIGVSGYSIADGTLLWNFNLTSAESASYFFTGETDGKFAWFKQETMQWYGFDALTGRQLWISEPYEHDCGMYTSSAAGNGASSPVIANGKLYAVAYDGMVHCFDMTTGHNDWNYYIGDAGYETPYDTWPLAGGLHVVADGKVFAATGEHSPSIPMWRGEKLVCVDATSGKEVWRILGWMQTPVVADGSLVAFNNYDSRIYCFAKGPSAVSVSASPKVASAGSSVLIEGTVIDKAVGTTESEQSARFPNGVPAISDDYMGPWMEYVYMQKPLPTNATGVPVRLQAMFSNGTVIDIGRVTSDIMGHFEYAWNPDTADTYKILATFEGSNSYWPSSEQCGLSVGPPQSNVPSASEIATQVLAQLPTATPITPGPSIPGASEVANQVLALLPSVSATELGIIIAVAVVAYTSNIRHCLFKKIEKMIPPFFFCLRLNGVVKACQTFS